MSKRADPLDAMVREYLSLMRRFPHSAEFPMKEFVEFQLISNPARQISTRIMGEIRSRGVPAVFKDLFAIDRKKAVERFCRDITLRGRELSDLVFNADMIGYVHSRFHREYVPEELKPTPEEEEAFRKNGVGEFKSEAAKRLVRKIHETFEKRKNVNGHLFVKNGEWHLFYFTFQDAFGTRMRKPLHWAMGDHIHYISHLWGHDIDETWRRIQEPQYSLNGVHIRYLDENRDETSSD